MTQPEVDTTASQYDSLRKWPEHYNEDMKAKHIEMENSNFVSCWRALQDRAYSVNVANGFWDAERNDGEMIALMHSELSEALEALRTGNGPDDKIPEFSGLEAELADTVIRIMDMAAGRNLKVVEAIVAKIERNRGRGHRHGKEF